MLGLSSLCAISFMGLVLLAARSGMGPVGQLRWPILLDAMTRLLGPGINVASVVAVAVVVYCAIIGPVCLLVAIRPIGGTIRDIWPIYLVPIAISSVAVVAGALAGHPLPHTRLGSWAKLIVVPLASLLVYVPLLRWAARDIWDELSGRLMKRFHRDVAVKSE
jgi:hypothetical protein